MHLEESLAVVPLLERFGGPVVDVGSGGGAPGIPVAAALPDRDVTLLEANGRKCEFLESVAREFPNVRVVRGRAEEQPVDEYGVALAKALASPPVAAEWCLPLVAPEALRSCSSGRAPTRRRWRRVSRQLGGGEPESHPGLLVLPKLEPTPPGFPRRAGVAKKRPLS